MKTSFSFVGEYTFRINCHRVSLRGVTSVIRLVFERNSTPTSQAAFPFPPVGLEPCSPQTAPLSLPRGVLPLTDLEASWPPFPLSGPLLATVLPPVEGFDPQLAPWLQDQSDEPEVVRRIGAAGRKGPGQWTGAEKTS